MKKNLLYVLLVFVVGTVHAQYYYPSVDSAWSYSDVISEDDGNYYNESTGLNGCALDDASIFSPSGERDDAYDGAFEFFVNTEDSVYTEANMTDTTGTTYTQAEQLIDGYYVSKQYYFSPIDPVVRVIFKIRNPSDSSRTAKIGILSNLGSDSNTKMDSSSTNTDSLTNADRWMITTDGYVDGDPINTWVRFGPGKIASSPIFGSTPEKGDDNYLDTVAVTIPSKSYALIMQFNRLDSTTNAARINTAKFNSYTTLYSAGYLAGLTGQQLEKIVNWDFALDTSSMIASTCEGVDYNFFGENIKTAGTYYHSLKNLQGIDSVVVLTLKVINTCGGSGVDNANVSKVSEVSVYPNPSNGLYTLKASNVLIVKVLNTSGTVVYSASGGVKSTIDITNQASGIYILQVATKTGMSQLMIVKQ